MADMTEHWHKLLAHWIPHNRCPMQPDQPQRNDHSIHTLKEIHHRPVNETIITILQVKCVCKAVLLTVHASLPASPPAQMKLVPSKTNDGPNRVADRAAWHRAVSKIGTSTSFWMVWYTPRKSFFPHPATQHLHHWWNICEKSWKKT